MKLHKSDMMLLIWLLILVLVYLVSPGNTATPIRISVDKHYCLSPCTVMVSIIIEKDAQNKMLALVWGYEGSSEWPVTDDTEYVRDVTLTEDGDHDIFATLLRGHHEFTAKTKVLVGDPDPPGKKGHG